ncbi:MAG: CCA tRNA nucleotidyltransferase [Candidatus Diapherotrites archaeon]
MQNARIRALLEKTIKRIRPTEEEIKKENYASKKMIQRIMKLKGKHLEAIVAGSIARGTQLKEDKDIDIFILFPKSLHHKELESEGLRIAKKTVEGLKYEIDFGQHPYLKAKFKGLEIELIPAYKVGKATERISAVDRTPFHNSYLQERLTEKMKDEIRLLKKFLKAIDCYGAELKVQGFSGYLTELLVLNRGNFLNVLKASGKWKKGEVIDLEHYYTKKDFPALRKKFGTPLIVIDPTDKERNAAAAVSLKQFQKFKENAEKFIQKPSAEFFFPKPTKILSSKKLKKKLEKKELMLIEIPYSKIHEDVVFGQLKKIAGQLAAELKKHEFKVLNEHTWSDQQKSMAILIELKKLKLKKTRLHAGPPIEMLKHKKKFLEKHAARTGEKIIKGRIHVIIPRKHVHASSLAREFMEKRKRKKGFISKQIKKKYKVLVKEGILSACKNKKLKEFLSKNL